MLYLDHAATTVVRPEVREAMAPYLDGDFGNPSGVHSVSRRAKNALEEARERAAGLLGAARPLEIVFTGGGTESDNLGVAGPVLGRDPLPAVVTSAIEHEAVLETVRFLGRLGHRTTVVPVDPAGRVTPDDVAAAVDSSTGVVSVMTANNETGVVQPIAAIAGAVRQVHAATLVHTDAVQAFIAEDVTVAATGADLISIASHKLGGPKGVGILYVRDGIELEPVLHGGGQELGRRSGTHDVAGIVGMVAAMESAVADRAAFRTRVGAARDAFEGRLTELVSGVVVNAPPESRLPQHSHVRISGVSAETLLIRLDQAGVAAAAGSACHSGAIDVSHVLAAMGMSEREAAECVRFTFGWVNEPEDGPRAAEVAARLVAELR
jgi:cysteine desulfurase